MPAHLVYIPLRRWYWNAQGGFQSTNSDPSRSIRPDCRFEGETIHANPNSALPCQIMYEQWILPKDDLTRAIMLIETIMGVNASAFP